MATKGVALYRQQMIIGRTKRQVETALYRRQQSGELLYCGPEIQLITRGPHAGQYGIPVYLRVVEPAPRPVWRIAAGVMAGLTVLALLTWWLLATLSGAALVALMVAALLLLARRVHRTVTVTTTQTTKVTVR